MTYRLAGLVAAALFAISCSKGPAPAKPGTPAFYWSAANQAYRSGDSIKTAEYLGQVAATENEFTTRARVWSMVVASGLTQGYMELGDAYENGARMNRSNPAAFRKQAAVARAAAAQASMQYTEAIHRFMEGAKEAAIPLAFEMPAGATEEPATLGKLAKGILPLGAEADSLHKAMLERGLVLRACRAVGQKDDIAKAAAVYRAGTVPRETFLLGMAQTMYEQSELFGPKKLDQPRRVSLLCTEALEALGLIPPTKETRALERRIQSTLKKMKVAS
jgi:hypothetical protein